MRKKLLLAEDSVTIRKVFDLVFARSDISVIAVDNGDDAVRLVGEIAPDLVVVDVTLPGKDGYAVASALREDNSTRHVPVLILSGTLAPFDEERFKACGAKGVVYKPFETRELVETVEGILEKAGVAPAAPSEVPAAAPLAAPHEPPPADEHWDFSDVLEDPSKGREEPVPGALLEAEGKDEGSAYDEFDVSIDEIEASAPAPVEQIEEIEEIEELQEIEEIIDEPPVVSEPPPPSPAVSEPPAPAPAASVPPVPALSAAPAVPEQDEALQAVLKEQFVARAEVVFRAVASEAVEKVMWEMMDRLSGEFSARIRESVEAVAWEVIPSTAEALIREEIARIRKQAGKPASQ